MKKKLSKLLILVLLFTIGCEKEATVIKKNVFKIELEANYTTGYEWSYKFNEEGIIDVVKDEYVINQNEEQLVGSGGKQVYEFKGLRAGEVVVTLFYKRAWEEQAIKTKEYILIVDKDLNIKEKK